MSIADSGVTSAVWIDAQLPPSLARHLTSMFGTTATHVADVAMLAADDEDIFEAARLAGVTAIVTKDEDFTRLLRQLGPPPQIVWVTCGNLRNSALLELIGRAWPGVLSLLQSGERLIEIGHRR